MDLRFRSHPPVGLCLPEVAPAGCRHFRQAPKTSNRPRRPRPPPPRKCRTPTLSRPLKALALPTRWLLTPHSTNSAIHWKLEGAPSSTDSIRSPRRCSRIALLRSETEWRLRHNLPGATTDGACGTRRPRYTPPCPPLKLSFCPLPAFGYALLLHRESMLFQLFCLELSRAPNFVFESVLWQKTAKR